MSNILEKTVEDKNLVWGRDLEQHPEKFLVHLSDESINELKNKRQLLKTNSKSSFSKLNDEINKFKNEKILNGVGLLIINGNRLNDFSKNEVKQIYELICNMLGTLYIQNIQSEKIVEIKDEGKSMTSGGRYHQTKEGGSYHTDSPHWTNVPDLVGLLCVNQAKNGGISNFVSTYTIHNEIFKKENGKLKALYEKFYFDKRGEFKTNESKTIFEPIFIFKDNKLHCRYLKNYIISGHEIANAPLSTSQKESIDLLEKITQVPENILSYDLQTNDMIFFDNHRMLHGRTEFEDYEEEEKKRRLLRTWIKMNPAKKPELVRFGRYFLGILNDLKRRPIDAAEELNISLDEMNDILEGNQEISPEIITRAKTIWPINLRDFYLIEDDCPKGIKIMREVDSKKSSRVMTRGGNPYYEYRDTVMSQVAPFRPEWIKELCVVNDNDPENKLVQWNNGHFMHQFTYFIGDVNFYYIDDDGTRKTAVMQTGDSMYITPFVPHTFSTRKNKNNENGLILALTYGDKLVGDVKQELACLSSELATKFSLDFSSKEKSSGSLIKFHREISSITITELSKRTKISNERLIKIEDGNILPSSVELSVLAQSLHVNTRELLSNDVKEKQVVIKTHEQCSSWKYPDNTERYIFTELASTSALAFSKAFEIKVQDSSSNDYDLQIGLHQYIYNVGTTNLSLNWELEGNVYSEIIKSGDSIYIKPFVKHNFRGNGNLVALRVGGRIPGDSQRELSTLGNKNASRAINETKLWFNAGN